MNQADLDFDRVHVWHPYSSLTDPLPVYTVAAAEGVRIRLTDGRELIDGMSSWWAAIHGYAHPRLVAAIQDQAARLAHVMFGGLTHAPAVDLCRLLVTITPPGLDRVFLCDSGSVSVEVALKMALQYQQARGLPGRHRILTVRGGYHGDTFHAMSVCDPVTGMHSLFRSSLPEQLFAPRPRCRFGADWDPDDITPLADLLAEHADSVAAVIVEPVVQGAGGMWFYHPAYLKALRALCDRFGALLILDEIATGFGRTGKLFAAEHAGISPDILCLGKALTGGTMTLAATLCTERVAGAICGAEPGLFMHGPTFMGNPLACGVATASIRLLLEQDWQGMIAGLEEQMRRELTPLAAEPAVTDVRVLGGIGVVETRVPVNVAEIQQFFVRRGVWIRPFGRLLYLMPPYVISAPDLTRLTTALAEAVRRGIGLDQAAPSS